MANVLITGASGKLGAKMIPRLVSQGHSVRGSSRRASAPARIQEKIEWARLDIETGEGMAQALSDVDTVVHAASRPFNRNVDIVGTEKLVAACKLAGVNHLIYVSIVGIDRIPLAYYRHKLAAEKLVESCGVEWSILRATQFHTLLDTVMQSISGYPILFLPLDFKFQLLDVGEAADAVSGMVGNNPAGRMPDIGGPQILTLGEIARKWLAAHKLKRIVVPLPLPGKVASGFRAGLNCVAENPYGKVTFDDWLYTTYSRGT